MIVIHDIPLIALQTALFSIIKNGQTMPIYGNVPTDAELPYITFGAITAKPTGVKDVNIWDMSITLDVWGAETDKELVNEAINDLATLISNYGPKLEIPNFTMVNTQIDLAECFPASEGGYHGDLTAVLTLNKSS